MGNPEQSRVAVSAEAKALIEARRLASQQSPQVPPSVPPQARMPRPRSGAQPVQGSPQRTSTPDVGYGDSQSSRYAKAPVGASFSEQVLSGENIVSARGDMRHVNEGQRNSRRVLAFAGAAAFALAGGLYLFGQHNAGASELGADAAVSPGALDGEQAVAMEVEMAPIEALNAEAVSPDNCMVEGSAVATIVVSGRMPLDYHLETSDGAVVTTPKYLTDPQTGYTESGIAEFQMDNTPIKIYSCEDNATDTATNGAVAEEDGKYMVNFNKLTYDAKVPTTGYGFSWTDYSEGSLVLGDAANGEQRLYWPNLQIQYDTENFTDKSVDAVNAFNVPYVDPDADEKNIQLTEDVTSVYSIAIDSILKQASIASEQSSFNQICTFADGMSNAASAIKLGTKLRIGGDVDIVNTTGAVGDIGGDIFKKKVDMIDFPEDRTERFDITACTVYVGDVTPTGEAAISASSQTGGN